MVPRSNTAGMNLALMKHWAMTSRLWALTSKHWALQVFTEGAVQDTPETSSYW